MYFIDVPKTITAVERIERRGNLKDIPFFSVNVSQFILVKPVAKLAMPVGNSIAWSMESNLMGKCLRTRPLALEMTPSTLSSLKLEQANMFLELSLSILNPL